MCCWELAILFVAPLFPALPRHAVASKQWWKPGPSWYVKNNYYFVEVSRFFLAEHSCSRLIKVTKTSKP